MVSTYHGDEMAKVKTKREEDEVNSVSVLDHNQNMSGVDLTDQIFHAYLPERKKMTN
jgi:hypothetical protein